jgi:acetyl-CoA acyltransferase
MCRGRLGWSRDLGMQVRRQVLGDDHVDRATAGTTDFTRDFQQLITDYAGAASGTRPGLDRRSRSMITLAALVARGHHEELAMHVRAARRNGLSVDEIKEVLLQTAICCGVPDAETGDAEITVAGGVESMTRAPWVLLKPSRPFPPGNLEAVSTTLGWRLVNERMPAEWTVSLEEGNEQLPEKYAISRERQDTFAARSDQLADAAWAAGFYDDLVMPVAGTELARDETIRSGSTPETLATLKPVFRADGTITAGNASPLNDGASAVLLGSETAADRIGSAPLARIASRGAHALDPPMFGYAPVEAAENALRRAGIGWADVGAVELNEAFAVQSLACIDAWGIDPEIVNVRGGAIAIGHPLGASGGRILGTLTKVLQERREHWGVAAICIGGGQALAVVVENTSGELS